jgi:hypothetical protein
MRRYLVPAMFLSTFFILGRLWNEIAGSRQTMVQQDDTVWAKTFQVAARDRIILKTGDAEITMDNSGNISISGVNITINSTNRLNIRAPGSVVLHGTSILEEGGSRIAAATPWMQPRMMSNG